MDHHESNNHNASRMRPPSRLPASTASRPPTAMLSEITDSQTNKLNLQSMIPPARKALKHPLNPAGTEPEPKRQTLADRAGQYPSNGPSIPRPAVNISGTSLVSGIKQPGSNLPARANSGLPRNNASNSVFSSTMGLGARPPSAAANRPASQFNKSTYGRARSKTQTRPATAMSHRVPDGEPGPQAPGKRNGTSELFKTPNPQLSSSGIPRKIIQNVLSQQYFPRKLSQSLSSVPKVFSSQKGASGSTLSMQSTTSIAPSDSQVTLQDEPCTTGVCGEGVSSNVTMRSRNRGMTAQSTRSPEAAPAQVPRTPMRTKVASKSVSWAAIAKLSMAAEDLITPFKTPTKPNFLTKDSNTKGFIAWDVDERLTEFDSKLDIVKDLVNGSISDRKLMEDTIEFLKSKLSETESKNGVLAEQLDSARREMNSLTLTLDTEKRAHQHDVEDGIRDHRNEIDHLRRDLTDEGERQRREHREQLEATERHWKNTLEDVEARKAREIQDLRARLGTEQDDLNLEMATKSREVENIKDRLEDVKGNLSREKALSDDLRLQISAKDTSIAQLDMHNKSLQAKMDYLQSDNKAQSDSFTQMESELREAERIRDECKEKLIQEETERRILFNKYQELKGNIRVMCRVRPSSDTSETEMAKIRFPDVKTSTEIEIMGPEERSSLGNVSRKTNLFEFDRVFTPAVQNVEVFGEISQLVQSALDGYNVCIFCYGQTGSGKTFTMSSADGMIPRATHMIYDTMTKLKEKSWTYTMQGSFVEVYNEELHDLLGDNSKKLEIRHDEQKKRTTITNCHSVGLDSAERVESMLERAQKNRSVAATKANEHSSRSHSVFVLRISGENSATGERCEGTLNLVDLAGSERLKHSQAEGERMKETQNINKSLSSLGDVIEALGSKAKHIPYRNSKLTHLLQYSLGGNSKTLMFVMASPQEAHLQETLASLKFATKVHNTHIGTAKTTKKVAAKPRSSDS